MTTEDLTRNGLRRTLFSMTWPMLFGIVSLLGFQLVDSAFIGQLGVEPLAALGFTLPMQQLIIGFQVGVGIATTAIISRTLGCGDAPLAHRLGGMVVLCGALAVALLCLLLWTLREPVVTLLGAIYPALVRRHLLHFDLLNINPVPALRQLAGITGPAMVSQLMPPISAMLATALVAGFGSSAVAAWGLGTRLEFFSIVAALALTMSLPPMVGRFLGAGELGHVRTLVRIAVRFVLVWQLAIAMLWLALSSLLPRLLTQDATVADALGDYLLRVCAGPAHCRRGWVRHPLPPGVGRYGRHAAL